MPWGQRLATFGICLAFKALTAILPFVPFGVGGVFAELNRFSGEGVGMKTVLAVPYAEKDEAKALGARWDSALRVWYVENVERIERFMRWMPSHLAAKSKNDNAQKPKRMASDGVLVVGANYFRMACSCAPWEPCQTCQRVVTAAGWGAEA